MKKIGVALLFVSALFAILFAVFDVDSSSFTISGYLRYISENIEPFPKLNLVIQSFEDLKNLLMYPVALVLCFLQNVSVILYGLFSVNLNYDSMTGIDPTGKIDGFQLSDLFNGSWWQSTFEEVFPWFYNVSSPIGGGGGGAR